MNEVLDHGLDFDAQQLSFLLAAVGQQTWSLK